MIFMREQISYETETIVKLQTLLVSALEVAPNTLTGRSKGLMYITQMELYRTNQNKNQTASHGPVAFLSLLFTSQPCEEIKLSYFVQ